MLKDDQELTAFIKGNVHGVGFRRATRKIATRLHLTGFVRNLSDGSVEICAHGTRKDLEALLTELKHIFAQNITEVDATFHDSHIDYVDFRIA